MTRRMNVPGHDADLALPWRDHAGAVWPDKPALAALQIMLDANHIEHGHALRDADHELDSRRDRFQHRIAGKRRRHIDYRRVAPGGAPRRFDGVENRNALEIGAALAGHHAGDHLRAVLAAGARVKLSRRAGDALGQHARVLVDQNTHRFAPRPPIASTTRRAASAISLAVITLMPESFRICLPRSTFVPATRTTSGSFSWTCRAASTTPSANTSQRMMPPKMLISTAFTRSSESRILKAAATFSALAPPPTSRKFAGSAPACFTISMVAIASPAPFTMQPIVPSRCT